MLRSTHQRLALGALVTGLGLAACTTPAASTVPSPSAMMAESPSPSAMMAESPSPSAMMAESPSPSAMMAESPSPSTK
jgi:hypothetical protein